MQFYAPSLRRTVLFVQDKHSFWTLPHRYIIILSLQLAICLFRTPGPHRGNWNGIAIVLGARIYRFPAQIEQGIPQWERGRSQALPAWSLLTVGIAGLVVNVREIFEGFNFRGQAIFTIKFSLTCTITKPYLGG